MRLNSKLSLSYRTNILSSQQFHAVHLVYSPTKKTAICQSFIMSLFQISDMSVTLLKLHTVLSLSYYVILLLCCSFNTNTSCILERCFYLLNRVEEYLALRKVNQSKKSHCLHLLQIHQFLPVKVKLPS